MRFASIGIVRRPLDTDHRQNDDGGGLGRGVDIFSAACASRLVGKPDDFTHVSPLFRAGDALHMPRMRRLKRAQGKRSINGCALFCLRCPPVVKRPVMPKLAADPRLDGLFDLALRDGVDIRPTLLRVLTDLYVQKPFHTQDEERQYVELATGLIDSVDATTRTAVAATLRDYPGAPAAVLHKLNSADAPATKLRSPEPKADDLTELFFSATSEERQLILANLVASERRARAPAASPEMLNRLESAARNRASAEFARALRLALGIQSNLAERIITDSSGEPLVVAAKALRMPAPMLQRILLLLNPAISHSVTRVYELARLFDEIPPQAADEIVAIWRGVQRRKPAHEAVAYDDERRSARSFTTHKPHRADPRPDHPPRKTGWKNRLDQ